MAYEPINWQCGDIITAEKLNAIERGIAEMNAEYVPNEWACGDVITAERLNHMEQGIAEGCGGGSSDFSTAQVTVENNSFSDVELPLIIVESVPVLGDVLSSVAYIDPQDTQTFSAVLYNNKAIVDVQGLNASVSGNASKENDAVTITGDCTITHNGAS